VDLNPAGAASSRALAVYAGAQAGWAMIGGAQHAGLWHGSAASWTDLNPAGAVDSTAFAVWGGWQAGWIDTSNGPRAGVWTGTAATWEELPLATSAAAYAGSYALGIWVDGYTISVVGYGVNAATNRNEALLWTKPVPGACYANCDRSTGAPVLNIGDFLCFQSRYVAGDPYANCDGSTTLPVLNIEDFICFQGRFAGGCP
jgi:hypothetical protein